jgi:hypothetical protein
VSHRRKARRQQKNHAIKVVFPECPSGKRGFESRKDAKAWNSRGARMGLDRLHPYLCEHCTFWHVGHLPKAVKKGDTDRHTYYDDRKTA